MGEEGVGAGHKFDPYPVAWLKRDVLLFANSIGCTVDELQFIYVWIAFDMSSLHRVLTTNSGTPPELQCLPDLSHPPTVQAYERRDP